MSALAQAESEPYRYDGIYEPREAAGYLMAGMPEDYQRHNPPTPPRVHSWIRAGLVAPDQRDVRGHERILDFDDLVTCQAIAVLRQHTRLTLRQILDAERFCARFFGVSRPFAYERFWYSTRDLVAALDDEFVISTIKRGQIGWRARITPELEELGQSLIFDRRSARPVEWEPPRWPGIALAPAVQFGVPCLKGTRIPTTALANYVEAGDDPDFVARSYGVEVADVERAVEWEREVRGVLDATTRTAQVSH
jgi:uncharacterized protein (DUF433 family)